MKKQNIITITKDQQRYLSATIVRHVWPERATEHNEHETSFNVNGVHLYDKRGVTAKCIIKCRSTYEKRFVAAKPVNGIEGMYAVNIGAFLKKYKEVSEIAARRDAWDKIDNDEEKRMDSIKESLPLDGDESDTLECNDSPNDPAPNHSKTYTAGVDLTLQQAIALFTNPDLLKRAGFDRFDAKTGIQIKDFSIEELKPFFQTVQEIRKAVPAPAR